MKAKYHVYSFEKLEVWKIGRGIKLELYQITKDFPKEETFHLVSQIRRAASSVTANIAEGSGRATAKDRASYTNMSFSSALELIDHLTTAYDLDYIDEKRYTDIRRELDKLLNKLNSYYKHQIKAGKNINQ